jgi:hypothetical protein
MGSDADLLASTAAPAVKTCSLCKQELPLDRFYKGTGRLGKQSRCKGCVNHRTRKDQQLYNRRGKLKRQYQLSIEGYEQMFISQCGLCAICGSEHPGGNSPHFKIDHDHTTGAIRALLCSECNLGLGKFHDDPQTLEAAAKYLRHHSQKDNNP